MKSEIKKIEKIANLILDVWRSKGEISQDNWDLLLEAFEHNKIKEILESEILINTKYYSTKTANEKRDIVNEIMLKFFEKIREDPEGCLADQKTGKASFGGARRYIRTISIRYCIEEIANLLLHDWRSKGKISEDYWALLLEAFDHKKIKEIIRTEIRIATKFYSTNPAYEKGDIENEPMVRFFEQTRKDPEGCLADQETGKASFGRMRGYIKTISKNYCIELINNPENSTSPYNPELVSRLPEETSDKNILDEKLIRKFCNKKMENRSNSKKKHYLIFFLRYAIGFSVKEISVLTGYSETNVTTICSRIMDEFQNDDDVKEAIEGIRNLKESKGFYGPPPENLVAYNIKAESFELKWSYPHEIRDEVDQFELQWAPFKFEGLFLLKKNKPQLLKYDPHWILNIHIENPQKKNTRRLYHKIDNLLPGTLYCCRIRCRKNKRIVSYFSPVFLVTTLK